VGDVELPLPQRLVGAVGGVVLVPDSSLNTYLHSIDNGVQVSVGRIRSSVQHGASCEPVPVEPKFKNTKGGALCAPYSNFLSIFLILKE
jgi:hypothetical protein